MALLKLYDEKSLLVGVQKDTVHLIHSTTSMEPIKKLIECHDIIDLTIEIRDKFPTIPPTLPQCDEAALMHLHYVTSELLVYYHHLLPRPDLDLYILNVRRLLTVYQVPRHKT